LKLYRDCAGIQLCGGCNNPIPNGTTAGCTVGATGTQILGASPLCLGTSYGSFTLAAVAVTSGYDIIQTCTSVRTICTNCNTRTAGSYSPGIEVYVFEGNVSLASIPSSCCLVNIGYGSCCRNTAVSTLVTPGMLNFYSQATINRCVAPCNAGPIFTNPPVFLACASQEFMTNLGAIDPDGDSLSYGFGRSLTAANTLAPYVSPFGPSVPFPYTGFTISFRPLIHKMVFI
jgi:hypothetical protein